MILNYKKTKNKNIKNSQKPNLLLDKKDFIKNYLSSDNNKNMNIDGFSNLISTIKNKKFLPDERLIFCIKMLGLSKYYSNFVQKKLNFEEFLALTNDDMTRMKLPKNQQKTVQQFSIDFLKFGNLYTIEEIKDFFRRKKNVNNFNHNYISKSFDKYNKKLNQNLNNYIDYNNIPINNYINGRIINNNIIETNFLRLNGKDNYKKTNSLINKKLKNEDINYRTEGDINAQFILNYNHKNFINKNKNKANNEIQKRNDLYYDMEEYQSYNQICNNFNISDFQDENMAQNYIDKNELKYNSDNDINKKIRNIQCKNINQNQNYNIKENSILNLKNSYNNFYSNKFIRNIQNFDYYPNNNNLYIPKKIMNYDTNCIYMNNSQKNYFNITPKSSTCNSRNKILQNKMNKYNKKNRNERPLSEGSKGVIMNNLNNYFIYNNYIEDNLKNMKFNIENDMNNMKINNIQVFNNNNNIKNKILNNLQTKDNDYLNKYMNRNNNNNSKKQKKNLNNIMSNTHAINNKRNCQQNLRNNIIKMNPNNNRINNFRKQNQIIQNYNNMNTDNSRNFNIKMIYNNDMNYTDSNYSKIGMNNIYNNYINNKKTKQTPKNQLPIKSNSNINFDEMNNFMLFPSQNKKYHNPIKQRLYNNQKENYIKSNNYNSSPNLKNNLSDINYDKRKKLNNIAKLEILKQEINELYNKMQMTNNMNSNNNIKNNIYHKGMVKNNFSKTYENFMNYDDIFDF